MRHIYIYAYICIHIVIHSMIIFYLLQNGCSKETKKELRGPGVLLGRSVHLQELWSTLLVSQRGMDPIEGP